MKGLKFSWIYDDAINVECVSDNIQTQGRRKLFYGGGLNKKTLATLLGRRRKTFKNRHWLKRPRAVL